MHGMSYVTARLYVSIDYLPLLALFPVSLILKTWEWPGDEAMPLYSVVANP